MQKDTVQLGPFIKIEEAAKILHTTKSAVYALVYRSKIPYYKRGRRLLFKREELIQWVEESRQEPISAT